MIISLSVNQLTVQNVITMMQRTVVNDPAGYHGGSNHCHSLCARWIKNNDVHNAFVQFFGDNSIVYHSIVTVDGKIVCDSLHGTFDGAGQYTFTQHDVVTTMKRIHEVPAQTIKTPSVGKH